jgi:hypothetical protein
MVSLMSLESLVACLNTKGAQEMVLTNLLVSLVQVQVSNESLSLFLILSRSLSTPLYPLLVLRARNVPRISHNFVI